MDKLFMWMLQQQNVKRDAIEKKITLTNATTNATNANATTNVNVNDDDSSTNNS
jgi:hypothetical protein